jgi:hypothetical protein
MQPACAGIAGSLRDSEAVNRRCPGCCVAEYLDRPVAVGDALSDYDVGWVNIALDAPRAAATALASLQRLADLGTPWSCPPTARCLPTPMPRCKSPSAAPNAAPLRAAQPSAVWHGRQRSATGHGGSRVSDFRADHIRCRDVVLVQGAGVQRVAVQCRRSTSTCNARHSDYFVMTAVCNVRSLHPTHGTTPLLCAGKARPGPPPAKEHNRHDQVATSRPTGGSLPLTRPP